MPIRVLWDEIIPSYLKEEDNPRLDVPQVIKMNKVIMMALKDIDCRIDDLETSLNNICDKLEVEKA